MAESLAVHMRGPMAKSTKYSIVSRLEITEEADKLLREIAGDNAMCVLKAMEPTFKLNPPRIKVKK
ncbi:MAG: hypothetical protein NT157_04080 [Candidatus Micrarchaeota archaeon]|nr:hypothetical protein [Candidatus Micrarchaeota archaeon]